MAKRPTRVPGAALAAVAGVVVALVASLAACAATTPTGGSPTGSSGSTVAGGSTSSNPVPATLGRVADSAIAARAVLTAADLPGGWTAGRARELSETDTALGESCPPLGARFEAVRRLTADAGRAKSAELHLRPKRLEIDNDVWILPTEADAVAMLGVVADPAYELCLRATVEASARRDQSTVGVNAAVRSRPIDAGDGSVGFDLQVTVSRTSGELKVYAFIAFIRVGRGVSAVSLLGDEELPVADLEQLIGPAGAKLAGALGAS